MPKKKEKTTIQVEVANELIDSSEPITLIQNANKEYQVLASSHVKTQEELDFEQASYNFNTDKHMIDKILQNEESQYTTSMDELNQLAQNTQNDINKITKINSLIKYYANKDDLVGKTVEVLSNNINTKYKLDYPVLPDNNKKAIKIKEKADRIVSNFVDNINLSKQIRKECVSTFLQGTYFSYMRGSSDGTYGITTYPLGLCQISDYIQDGEPLIYIDMQKLKSAIQTSQQKYRNIKSSFIKFNTSVEDEIKNNYPPEVYQAFLDKSNMAFLDPKRTGIHKINDNGDGLYGLSPIFKALPSLLMLETIEKVDRDLVLMKNKSIIHQVLRKELMGKDFEKTQNFKEMQYAHTELVKAMAQKTVLLTTPAYVEKVEVIQNKTDLTDPVVTASYRNKILNSLGISFIANDSKSSFNSVEISVKELLRMINKIVEQFQDTLNKYIKTLCIENGVDITYAPKLIIEKTELMDLDSLLKYVDTLYSKIGLSYESILEMLGLDYSTEKRRREQENDNNTDEVFSPHITSYTASDSEKGDLLNDGNKQSEENQNDNKDQQAQNKARKDGQQ